MARVTVYTTTFCGYCMAAKRLLEKRELEFEEININAKPEFRREMLERSQGRYTVPQIFIDSEGIGGYTELRALDRSGELDLLLRATIPSPG